MDLDIVPMQIGELIKNVVVVVVDSRDALSGFGDGDRAHREGYGAARICVQCQLVPAGENSADMADEFVPNFGQPFVRGEVYMDAPWRFALCAEAMRGSDGEGYVDADEPTGSGWTSGQGLLQKDRDAYESTPCTCRL